MAHYYKAPSNDIGGPPLTGCELEADPWLISSHVPLPMLQEE